MYHTLLLLQLTSEVLLTEKIHIVDFQSSQICFPEKLKKKSLVLMYLNVDYIEVFLLPTAVCLGVLSASVLSS